MSSQQNWVPIESNPEVMNKFLSNIGLPDEWSVVDVIGLDEELLQFIESPVLSLILLFPVIDDKSSDSSEDKQISSQTKDDEQKGVYFMRQTIRNACGTIALIHSVANNCHRIQLRDGSSLKLFLDSSQDLTPEERGTLLESNEDICNAHHIYAKEGQTSAPTADSHIDNHFVAFVHKNGFLYELDGRKAGPINHGKSSDETFVSDAARLCRQFMAKDPNNLNFTVVALSRQNQN